MKAIVVQTPGRVACVEMPEPDGPGSTVQMEAANIGIGDIRAIRGQRRSISHEQDMRFPHVLGFAGVGRLVKLDAAAQARGLRIGDRLAIAGVSGCGRCDWCERGLVNLCDRVQLTGIDAPATGLWRERVSVAGARLYRIGESVDYRVATIVTEIATAARAVERSRFENGDSVAIIGVGGHGMLAVQIVRHWGASTIVAVDPSAEAREVALRYGATRTFPPDEYERHVRANPENGPRRVLHLTSAKGSIALSVRAVARLGVIAAVGTPDENPVIVPEYYQMMIVKEATIIGCYSKS